MIYILALMKEIENDSFSIYLNERETEAIIKNEPYDSKYSVLSPSFFPLFPYLLLGKIKTSFKNIQTVSEGVGLLIGDDIVLTSAHNIYQGKLSKIKSIEFIPLMTGAVRLLKPVQCRKYSMLKTFQDLKNKVLNDDTVNNSDILNSDFAICFLKCKLGREIKEMFNLHNDKHFDFWPHGNRLFSFFIHKNKDIKTILEQFENGELKKEVSMISYATFKNEYLKEPNFRYRKYINTMISRGINTTYQASSRNGSLILTNEGTMNSIRMSTASLASNCMINNSYENNCVDTFYPIFNISNKSRDQKHRDNQIFFDEERNNVLLCEAEGNLVKPFSKNIYKKDTEISRQTYSTIADRPTGITLSTNDNLKLSSDTKSQYELNYVFTTYIGQSGSPIFLRKSKDEYILIGIHSRSSPTSSIHSNKSNYIIESGFSQYNIGLSLNGEVHNSIIEMIELDHFEEYTLVEHDTSNHLIIDFIYENVLIYSGIFPLNFFIYNFFSIVSESCLSVDRKYIQLKKDANTFTYEECEGNKKLLKEIVNDDNYRMSLTIIVDEEKYANDTSKVIVRKVNDIKGNCGKGKERMIMLIVNTIKTELSSINNKNMLLYGKLYSKVQTNVVKDLNKYLQ